MELGVEAARWVVGKALGPVSSGLLESWAASTELGSNIEALRMELLYAEGMLNNASGGRGRVSQHIQNPALSELLHKLRDLAYRADDVLDELEYFRIQDELDGTYHAAQERDGGCLRNHALTARHTARAIAKMLGLSKCSGRSAAHAEPDEDDNTSTRGAPCGNWLCRRGLKTSEDDDHEEEEEEEAPSHRQVGNVCMGRITSAVRGTIHSAGKHIPCYSQDAANSSANIASSTGHGFLCCSRPAKEPRTERIDIQASKLKFYRVETSQKMKDIVEQLKPLCAKVSTILNLELLAANLRNNGQYMASGRPITTSESAEPAFYGRKEVTSKVIHDITMGEYRNIDLTVLPIVGPGGIGKTTLTQHIYKELEAHFEVKLWICVSVNYFNVSRLTQEIADKLKKEEKGSPENQIEEGLKSKRFLLVLDDMWSCSYEDEWNRFLIPFKKGQTKGNVILVTTRFPALAQMVKTTDHWKELEGLDKEEFEKLFFAYVFGDKKPADNHSNLLDIGYKIIEKLKGSPLAAKTVGRLLRNNLDLGHWTRVLESKEWESQDGDHDIMPALKLSFDYLPFHLQQCFAYCTLFPEDYKFGREEIIHFWIGLDVLHSRGEIKKIEDIGQNYLTELVNHGFFKKEEDNGRACYAIHDLMHELGLKVSADECLSIYSSNVRSIHILPSIRHLSINIDDSSVKDSKGFDTCKEDFSVLRERLKVENLHTLLLFGKHQTSFVKTLHGLFSKAKGLRVILVSAGFYSMEDLLHNFSELIHLRYLRVDSCWPNVLVPSNNISRFYHMRVLDLRGCMEDCHDFPRYLSNLVKLRHFLVPDDTVHSRIFEVGKLKSLQGLKRFEVGKESEGFELSQIGHLVQICGSLRIDNLENVDGREGADEAKLIHKKNLNELILNWNTEQSNRDPAREGQVLEGLKPHSNLEKLSIRGHRGGICPSWLGQNLSVENLETLCLDGVDWETFPPVGELQLVNKGAEEKLSKSPNQHFKNLKGIELANLAKLERWVVGSSGELLSHLEVLKIKGCPELVELPVSESAGNQQDVKTRLPKLQELVIEGCPKLLSLAPIPWTRTLCKINISDVGLAFESLSYTKDYDSALSLRITGKDTKDSALFWMALDFDNLTEVKKLSIDRCPSLPLDGLQKMSCLKSIQIINCNDNAFGDGSRVGYKFPAEKMYMDGLGATSGKELTQVLSYMPKISELSISGCEKITGLGVFQQKVSEHGGEQHKSGSEEEKILEAAAEAEEGTEGLLLLPPQLEELTIWKCPELSLRPDSFQGLCSLSTLVISDCSKVEGMLAPHTNLGPLDYLWVFRTPNFFTTQAQTQLPPISLSCSKLVTDDFVGVLAAPICGFLSSSLTHLHLYGNAEMEGFTTEQDEALQLLTTLRHLQLCSLEKLQSLPAGLPRSTSLKELRIEMCPSIRLLPKDGLPNSLQKLIIYHCSAIRSLAGLPNSLQDLRIIDCPAFCSLPKDGLPNSLQKLQISSCPAIRSLPKDGLPNSLQQLEIHDCPSIRALPKGGLPTSLWQLDVEDGNSEALKRQCRKLIGTIPIVKA